MIDSNKLVKQRKSSNHCFDNLRSIVPDDISQIQSAVNQALSLQPDLILTSGGTGFSPTDVTPEAIEPLITKQCNSLTQYMQAEAVRSITPLACLSRSVIGIVAHDKGQTMIVCLPGKPKAVKENF